MTGNACDRGGRIGTTPRAKVTVVFTGSWEAHPSQFYDGSNEPRDPSDAELAEAMRKYGSLARVLVDWNLQECIEVYVGREKVW